MSIRAGQRRDVIAGALSRPRFVSRAEAFDRPCERGFNVCSPSILVAETLQVNRANV
ncbi:hypothetical protein [Caballeronia sp. INDeC2]|uniref:hypothetical protein n=1 Tax=Caballeronia sp. INDeC2 TaxID=2921747 RepID=UPI002027C28E|nr:hypothetical protein [Caballeronia sp. INDeC2]